MCLLGISITNSYMVSLWNIYDVAALTLTDIFYSPFVFFEFGLISSVLSFLNHMKIRRSYKDIKSIFWTTLLVTTVFSLLSMLIIRAEFLNFMRLFHQNIVIANKAQHYLNIDVYVFLPIGILELLRMVFMTMGNLRWILYSSILPLLFNVLFNNILIFGHLGFPAMGLYGAAYADIISNVLTLGIICVIAYKKRFYRFLFVPTHVNIYLWMGRILKNGLVLGFSRSIVGLNYGMLDLMAGWISNGALIAEQFAVNIVTLYYGFLYSIKYAGIIPLSRAVGSGNIAQFIQISKIIAWFMLGGAGISSILSLGTIVYFSYYVIHDSAILSLFLSISFFIIFYNVIDAFNLFPYTLLYTINDIVFIGMLEVVGYALINPVIVYVLAFPLGFGLPGLWAGDLIYVTLSGIVMLARFFWIKKHYKLFRAVPNASSNMIS